PALTYRCGGSTGLGVHARCTCFPFHPPAGFAGGHLERVRQFYTVPQRNKKYSVATAQQLRAKAGSRSSSATARQRIDDLEILPAVNDIGGLIHHGKSIESCLLLLDLSRFLKL